MKYATFKRMKPKYKVRLIGVVLVAFALFIGLLYGISYGFRALSTQLNTTKLNGVTAANVLTKPTMNELLTVLGQDDSANVLVLDSVATIDDKGAVCALEMNLISYTSKGMSERWTLTADIKKAHLRKTETSAADVDKALRIKKTTLKEYYPAFSRMTAPNLQQYLLEKSPSGTGGQYLFTENFGDNLNPDYMTKIDGGLPGLWVSKIGSVNEVQENFEKPAECIATVVSVRVMEAQKGFLNSKKQTLQDAKDQFVVLLEVGPF